MKLLTKEVLEKFPPLYSQEDKGEEAVAQVKFFTPWTSWTWFASEYDPMEKIFFGKVIGLETEYTLQEGDGDIGEERVRKKPKYCSICGCRKEEHSSYDDACRAGWPITGPPNAGSCLCPGYKE